MKTFLYSLLIVLVAQIAVAQNDSETFPDAQRLKKVGQAGYTFLKIGVDARSTALAEAAVTLQGDAATLFFNPAGITAVEDKSFFVGHTLWFADIGKSAFSYAMRVGQIGHFGISALVMDYNTIEGTEIDPFNPVGYRDTGNIGVQEYAIGLTYGKRFTDKFGIGITAKFCSQDFVVTNSQTVAFDIGTIYDVGWNGVKVAMSIQHFSKNMKYVEESFQLPLTFHIGASVDVLDLINAGTEDHDLDFLFEGNNPIDYSERFHTGFEYWYRDIIALRTGYKFNYDEAGLTLGTGIKYNMLDFNYSYAGFGEYLGSVNRVSMTLNF